MTRIGFISDVHGNHEALAAVLRDSTKAGIDAMVCLGDVVGYGPDPEACIDMVSASCDLSIMGNHDEAMLRQDVDRRFNNHAWRGIEYSRIRLSPGQLMLINAMRAGAELEGLSLAHGSFGANRYAYLYTPESARAAFAEMRTEIGLIGHTHIPSIFMEVDPGAVQARRIGPNEVIGLPREARFILNPGSVGQPRDRNPDASWGVLDLGARTFQARRVAYDIDAVQRRISSRGLPEHVALRLRAGV